MDLLLPLAQADSPYADTRLELVVVFVFFIILVGIIVVVVGGILMALGGTAALAAGKPMLLLKYFLLWMAGLSAVAWVLEGDKVTYGWVAVFAGILAFIQAAFRRVQEIAK